ncbi:Phosphopantetheine attachment site, partial [Pedobacter steynii]
VSLNSIRHFKENDNDEAQLAKCLGQLWSHGIEPDWSAYHTGERRKRISLPTYSFEPIAYPTEVNPLEQLSVLTTASKKTITAENLQDCIYYPIWKQAIPPVITGNKIKPTYLFFSLDDEFASSLKSEFKKQDHEVIEVVLGSVFKSHHQGKIEIDPLIPLHFEQLMDILRGNQVKITHLIYAWAAKKNLPDLKLDLNDIGINLAYFSLINIFKKLAFHHQLTGLSISILTDSLHRIAGDEKIPYAQSLLLGLMNVFPQEHEVICHNIDVDFRERPSEFAIDVANEIHADREVSNRIVALRKGQRWIPDFSLHTGPLAENTTSIKTGGIYLITGGLGNVGFVLAKFLIQKYDAKVVLTGRKKMQDQSADERSFLRLKLLQEISKDVYYYDADVSDLHSFRKTIEKVEKNIGLIAGVLHTAGTLDQQYFEFAEDITAEKTFAIFGAKVLGIENIHKIFKNRNPDFVWITSSLASVLGGLKFSAYAAANLYVNFFISSVIGKLPDWKCVSLAELSFDGVPDINRPDHPALNPEQLARLFEWSLSVKKQPLLLETVVDLYSRLDKAYAEKEQAFSTETMKEMEMLDREHFNHAYVPAGTETEIRILNIFKHFFFKENIGIRDNFFELGGDSLRAMALIKKIKTEFEINLPLKDFFTLQNIEELAAEIEERCWINKRSDKKNISII